MMAQNWWDEPNQTEDTTSGNWWDGWWNNVQSQAQNWANQFTEQWQPAPTYQPRQETLPSDSGNWNDWNYTPPQEPTSEQPYQEYRPPQETQPSDSESWSDWNWQPQPETQPAQNVYPDQIDPRSVASAGVSDYANAYYRDDAPPPQSPPSPFQGYQRADTSPSVKRDAIDESSRFVPGEGVILTNDGELVYRPNANLSTVNKPTTAETGANYIPTNAYQADNPRDARQAQAMNPPTSQPATSPLWQSYMNERKKDPFANVPGYTSPAERKLFDTVTGSTVGADTSRLPQNVRVYVDQHRQANPFAAGSKEAQAFDRYQTMLWTEDAKYKDALVKNGMTQAAAMKVAMPASRQLALWEQAQGQTQIKPLTNMSGWDRSRAPDTTVPMTPKEYSGLTGEPSRGTPQEMMQFGTLATDKNGKPFFVNGFYGTILDKKGQHLPGTWQQFGTQQDAIGQIQALMKAGKMSKEQANEYAYLIGLTNAPTTTRAQGAGTPRLTAAETRAAQSGYPSYYGGASGYGSAYGGGYPSYYGGGGSGSSGGDTTPSTVQMPGWNRAWQKVRV